MPWPGWKVTSALVSIDLDGVTGLGQLVRQRHREARRVRGGDELLRAGRRRWAPRCEPASSRRSVPIPDESRETRPLPSSSEPSQWALAVRVVAMRSPSCGTTAVVQRGRSRPYPSDTMADVDIPEVARHLLRRGRRRGDVPAAGAPVLRRASPTTRSCARSTRRRTSPAPRSGCGCSSCSTGAGRGPTPSSAGTRGCGCATCRSGSARRERDAWLRHMRDVDRRARAAAEPRGACSGTTW